MTALITAPFRFSWFDWFCLWYPPGWLILFNRHWQHYHADPEGWNWLEYLLFLIPGGFYGALLLRWLRLGFKSPKPVTRQFDPAYQRHFQTEILTPIATHYFRAELHGLEHLPDRGGAIGVMNHTGMCFPWDFLCLGVLLSQGQNWQAQPIAHTLFFDHPWFAWWLPSGWAEALGGVRADQRSFQSQMQRLATPEHRDLPHSSDCHPVAAATLASPTAASRTVLLYAPESWRGVMKGWTRRYQLETFDPSFIRLSRRYQIPIVPIVCLGSEELHPWTWNSRSLARWLGLPLLPISPLLLFFLLFPSLGVWAVRTRLRYYLQPMHTVSQGNAESSKEDGSELLRSGSQSANYQEAETLRAGLQRELLRLRNQREFGLSCEE